MVQVKGAITLILGVIFIYMLLSSAVPTLFGNTAFAIWIGAVNYAWVATILVFLALVGSLLKAVDVI